uniref:NmrA-like domain-containing protein n=1 Tax=Aplanochytrium stocchinoi TaxID=215587 RepID=A0A7S3PPC8_9STRA|mmetsp:Transcript_32579/g.40092  ORF Transcript_32579/g.40092 Transcript_32579/m.40092 type:complete len:326 (+) Transcript_32579:226-1203(+)
MKYRQTVLIVGSTGNIGSPTVLNLGKNHPDIQVKALVRPGAKVPETWNEFDNVQVVRCDLNDHAKVDQVVQGCDRIALITRNSNTQKEQELAVIEAARKHKVGFLAKISAYKHIVYEDSPVYCFRDHHAILKVLTKQTELDYAIVSPCFAYANHFMLSIPALKNGSPVKTPWPVDLKLPVQDGRDVADLLAKIMVTDNLAPYSKQHLELFGHHYSMSEMVQALGMAMGIPEAKCEQCTREEYQAILEASQLPTGLAEMISYIMTENVRLAESLQAGSVEETEKLIGHPVKDFPTFLRDFGLVEASEVRLEKFNRDNNHIPSCVQK